MFNSLFLRRCNLCTNHSYPLPLAWHGGVKFVVKSLLKAQPPGANNNKEQQWEVVLMKNKYEKGGGGGACMSAGKCRDSKINVKIL